MSNSSSTEFYLIRIFQFEIIDNQKNFMKS